MKKSKRIKENKAVTLIALVVTIVVLIILAGISISALTGDKGIINQAHTAKEDTEIASWEEQIDLAIIDAEKKHRNPTLEDVKEELKNKGVIDEYSQVNEDGVITTNEPSYTIEGKLDEYIKKSIAPGVTASQNEPYIDKNEDKAIIPAGFKVSENEKEQTIDDGLVVKDGVGNEFVWIPVETAIAEEEQDGDTNKAMAVKVGENYRGLLYDFTDSGSEVMDGCITTTSGHREPDVLDASNYGYYDNYYYGSAGYDSLELMKEGLQDEYNKMIESVKEYKGFYVGRYELGLDGNGNPTSKKAESGITTADASKTETYMWYGLYKKSKEYAPEKEQKSVVSSMIWGSQYDAMMNWMQANNVKVNQKVTGNQNTTTGTNENDKLKNIYDLYGCHYEWTSEVFAIGSRVRRRWRFRRQ